ncbi:TlpA family protein disulfide reductase [Phototrophicus methaneseepsis]|uniref:TlpA family protein disulfide reductase n=1 Tax=Phototrophicus methaneseepsis TaxID=2710758 RepID=A0A7S8IE07_9CHLR|nr:TlpA disulfide reductase family protein [Phototrophicus methaneseepsis]QPC82081.1 TlpA family protein disulfide reductase [Phototrophicus methaneseepsis]
MMTELDFLQEADPKPTRRSFSPGSIAILIGLIVFAVVLAVQLGNQRVIQPQPGEAIRDFSLTTFEGEALNTADLRGKILVINFWGSWCAPCRDEAPDLQAIWEDYGGEDVVLIGVNWNDIEGSARAFIDEFGLTFPNGPDIGEKIAEQYAITGAPETFIVDQEGTIAAAIIQPTNYDALAQVITRLQANGGTDS